MRHGASHTRLELGKFLLLVGCSRGHFSLFAAGRDARRAARARGPGAEPRRHAGRTTRAQALPTGLGLRIDRTSAPTRRSPPAASCSRIHRRAPRRGGSARFASGSAPGPRTTTVPVLVGQTERTAQIRLEQDGLEIGRSRSSARPTTRPMRSWRRIRRPIVARPAGLAAAQSRRSRRRPT